MPIREAHWPDDEAILLSFVQGLQEYEAALEPNRRLDPEWVREHWRITRDRHARLHGIMLLAEDDTGAPVGWAFAHDQTDEIYVVTPERSHGFLAELYVVPAARGAGHGRALIKACEMWARGRGHKLLMVGVLPGNAGAVRAYAASGFAPYSLTMRRYL